MRYLLVVGFACEVYRREPLARLFMQNKLIDEFYIQHHKDTLDTDFEKFSENIHILQKNLLAIDSHLKVRMKNFPPLRFYEVEIDQSNNDMLELRIDINNNDTNYNNGFMTSSTFIKLQVFYFFPLNEKLLTRLNKIMIKNKFNKNYNWSQSNQNFIFNLTINGVEWKGKNGKNFNNLKNNIFHKHKIGGDGHFTCILVKKYGIFMSILSKSYRYNFNKIFLDHFYNKYRQYANQRNTD
jgi:hypothetical protein